MAGADDRVKSAPRNYVIFALLMVVALALAARERFGPHHGRGESDSALRLMIVGSSTATSAALDEVDGFSVMRIGQAEVIALGRELVDDEAPAYLAAIAYADQHGYGFIALALGEEDEGPAGTSWELDLGDPGIEALPPVSVDFVVFSVGDLAPKGPRMRFVELADLDYEATSAELESVRLALYDHPDLRALWDNEGQPAQLQARQVLSNRGLLDRRVAMTRDQARWRELTQLWPAPGEIAGSLAGAWEQVRAAPVLGGVLVEVRPARLAVSVFRRPAIELSNSVSLWFVPFAALSDAQPDESLSRARCVGMPATLRAEGSEISVAPDGGSLVLRETPTSAAQLFVFDEQAALEGNCLASLGATLPVGQPALGRPNAARRMAWHYEEDWLHWFVHGSQQREPVNQIGASSGAWWVDDTLLAMIAARPLGDLNGLDQGFEQVVTLLDTQARRADVDGRFARVELGAAALFPELDPRSEAAALIDLRPAGPAELLLLTERCEQDTSTARRPCLHRLRTATPLAALTAAAVVPGAREAAGAPAHEVETLGPIGPYLALAIAAEGGRAAWTAADGEGGAWLMSADLRGPARLEARRVDADDLADATPRISADGRIVLSEVSVPLAELGSLSIARAFVSPAPPALVPAPGSAPARQGSLQAE